MTDYLSQDLLLPKPVNTGRRWLAALIDYILFFSCYMGCLMFWGEKSINDDGSVGYTAHGFPAFIAIASWWVLLPILEGLTGQTVGKAILGIKAVRVNGTKASVGNCIVRHLFDVVDGFPFGIIGVAVASGNDLKQRVGDLVAKTMVVPKTSATF